MDQLCLCYPESILRGKRSYYFHSTEDLADIFHSWKKEQQEEFLDFCTGTKGVKILYDYLLLIIVILL